MLLSLAFIFFAAISSSLLFEKVKLPKIIGLLLAGILIGPYFFNVIDASILENSVDIRKIALVIILIKAGLTIKISDFKTIGWVAVLMAFVPACIELLAYILLAPIMFDISYSEAALMGSVMAAVSPAVVVPRMVALIEQNIGTEKRIPQLILAGASLDDIVVIVLFTSFLGVVQSGNFRILTLLDIPISIISSVIIGLMLGIVFVNMLKDIHRFGSLPAAYRCLLLLSFAFIPMAIEAKFSHVLPFSGLLSVLVMVIQMSRGMSENVVNHFSRFFSNTWIIGEILLFICVGAIVDVRYVGEAGLAAVILIFLTLIIRAFAVFICVSGTGFTFREKVFCVIAYLPKATVQAAIGGIPLAVGLSSGKLILSIAVLGILITAPLGAILLDRFGRTLLTGK
ncbi:cation:proton antiporter domain-containing protein [Streptococcus sp. S784/96/1]|uniref:cation:proton antiporter domain-containing protein n=1 Tax=Streptococcus sp. S784/96/1 TaxID=2653499 RepID=UPI0013897FE5|nr:cation:proton antiporter [Streptococcus sp. S784/96/1]